MVKIFVSIINFNGEDDTIECLRSLDKISKNAFDLEAVVIDNGSRDVFKAEARDYRNFSLHIVRSEENLGFAGGQNLGIKYALSKGADFVLVLNNDVMLDKEFLVNLLATFSQKNDCAVVCPKIYFAKGYEFHKDRYKDDERGKVIWYAGGVMDWKNVIAYHKGVDKVDKGQFNKVSETEFATGCCMMVKKDVFDSVGFFDEKYFLYYEDSDFSMRAKAKGINIYFQPESVIWHLNAGSAGGSGSSLQDYYITRNRLLFGLKYAGVRAKFALIRESAKLLIRGRRWQKRAVFDYYLGNLGKGSYK